jgi:hypothetical protein
MGLTKSQRIGGIKSDISWLSYRDRIKLIPALLFGKATDVNGKRITL